MSSAAQLSFLLYNLLTTQYLGSTLTNSYAAIYLTTQAILLIAITRNLLLKYLHYLHPNLTSGYTIALTLILLTLSTLPPTITFLWKVLTAITLLGSIQILPGILMLLLKTLSLAYYLGILGDTLLIPNTSNTTSYSRILLTHHISTPALTLISSFSLIAAIGYT